MKIIIKKNQFQFFFYYKLIYCIFKNLIQTSIFHRIFYGMMKSCRFIQLDRNIEYIFNNILDNIMSSEAPKTAKEPFVPKYEIAAGLHKGRKLEKFVSKRVRPTRRTQVISFIYLFFPQFIYFSVEKKQTC